MRRPLWLNRALLMLTDAVLVNVTVLAALLLRFDGSVPEAFLRSYLYIAGPRTALMVLIFYFGGLYHSLWRYASVEEFLGVLRTVTLSALPFGAVVFLRLVPEFPRSVVLVTWVLDVVSIAGIRLLIRIVRRAAANTRGGVVPERRKVLIVGAGEAGVLVARELTRHEELRQWPVGFIDDDPAKQRMTIAGLQVLSTRQQLVELIHKHQIDDVIIAMPSAPTAVIREIVDQCSRLVTLRIVPGVYELIDGKITLNQIRSVRLEDLLGRETVRLDMDQIASYLTGQRVLVTGAGGSIGSELCRQISRFAPGVLLLLGNEENSIYELDLELRQTFPKLKVQPIIANIRDRSRMARVYAEFKPHVVFHAAAHKHVPLMEEHPDEAIKNNVLGTRIVAELARESGVQRFVLISTDKAVNPTSVMGASKRIAEMVIQRLGGGATKFMAVRFGNVLGSRGSVVPVFQSQILRGGPVTVTHPDMVRYFMTIPEASQLVLQAGAIGQGGEVFVLDMGEPVRIVDLARNLIRLSGFEPEQDIPIVFSGIRPGEKLYEELLTAEEGTKATRHSRIFVANLVRSLGDAEFWHALASLERAADAGDQAVIRNLLLTMIPTYQLAAPAAEQVAAALDTNSPVSPVGTAHTGA